MKTKRVLFVRTMVVLLLEAFLVPAEADAREMRPDAAPGAKHHQNSELSRLDSYGDPLPSGAAARLGTSRFRHAGSVITGGGAEEVLFTSDGKALFTLGLGNPLRLWDAASGKQLRQFGTLKREATATPNLMARFGSKGKLIALSADGSALAVRVNDLLQVWNTATGELSGERTYSGYGLAISSDGKILTLVEHDGGYGSPAKITTWEVATGTTQELHSIPLNATSFALSPDGKTLMSTDATDNVNTYLRFWDVATGKERHQAEYDHFNTWRSTFSADGRLIAMTGIDSPVPGGRLDGIVYVWDLVSGKEVAQVGGDKVGTFAMAFSPDNQLLATGSGAGPIRIWELASGKLLRECQGYRSHVVSLAFSPDGTQLASGATYVDHTARIWDVATGQELTSATEGHVGPVLSVAYLPDGTGLVSGGRDGLVGLWNCESGRLQQPLFRAGEMEAIAAPSGDGETIVAIGSIFVPEKKDNSTTSLMSPKFPNTVSIWDAATGMKVREFAGPKGIPLSLTVSQDGQTGTSTFVQTVKNRDVAGVAFGLDKKQVPFCWDFAAEKEQRVKKPGPGDCLQFSPDGKLLSAHQITKNGNEESNLISLWEVDSGNKLADIHGPSNFFLVTLSCQAISPDGRYVATSGTFPDTSNPENNQGVDKSSIQLWCPSSPTEKSIMIKDYAGQVTALAFSPDSKLLASASVEGVIRLWDTATGTACGSFAGYDGDVWCLAFSPDGRQLAAGNNDSTILLWDVASLVQE